VLDVVQKLDFLFNFGQQVFRMAFGFFMVAVPFVVKNVSLQLMLCIFDLMNFVLELIVILKLVKFVALVVASGPFIGARP
jgi:hypothetical protein